MWKRIIPLLWLACMLLPVAYIVQFWPPARAAFNWLFGPLWMHIVSHAFLFAALAYLVAAVLGEQLFGSAPWRVALGVLGLVVAAAMFQECIQLSYKARPVVFDDIFDMGVDLAGGVVGLGVYWALQRCSQRLPSERKQ